MRIAVVCEPPLFALPPLFVPPRNAVVISATAAVIDFTTVVIVTTGVLIVATAFVIRRHRRWYVCHCQASAADVDAVIAVVCKKTVV